MVHLPFGEHALAKHDDWVENKKNNNKFKKIKTVMISRFNMIILNSIDVSMFFAGLWIGT